MAFVQKLQDAVNRKRLPKDETAVPVPTPTPSAVSGAQTGLLNLGNQLATRVAARRARNQQAVTPAPSPTTTPVPTATPAPAPAATTPTTSTAPAGSSSVADNLKGLLASDSDYIKLARASGERTAQARGLLNSSLAAGNSQAAAIAAALPIASQDAATIATRENTVLQGDISKDNALALQAAQDKTSMERLQAQIASQEGLATKEQTAEMARLKESIAAADRQALLGAQTSLQQSQIAANSQLTGDYLSALGQLSSNAEMKPADRAKMIAEFQRVTENGRAYATTIQTVPLTYSAAA